MDFDFTTETITPDSTTLLTIGGTGALEVPTGTTANRPGSPANGALRYNTDINDIEGYINSSWVPLALTSSAVLSFSAGTTGFTPSTTTTGAVTLAGTLNVANGGTGLSSTPTNGQIDIGNGTGFTRSTITAGTAISVTNGVGTITIANTGVTSLAGTAGNITASTSTGAITLNLATIVQGSTGTSFVKVALDTFGRVIDNTAVVQADLTGLLGTYYLPESGGTMSGSITFPGTSGITVTGLPTPVNPSDAVPKSYVDATSNGLSWKNVAMVATTENITLSGLQTIDTYTTLAGDRVLVKNQTTQTQNGIYIAAPGAWARSLDANTGVELEGAAIYIDQGGQANTAWVQTTQGPLTIGSSNIVFVQFSGAGTYSAGAGLTLAGTTFSITAPIAATLGGTGTITAPTSGQVLVGTSAGAYTPATIGTGTGISTTTGSGTLTINNTGVTSNVAGTGISVSSATGAVTITNTGVTSAVAGTGIGVSSGTGAVTFTNTGVTSITGTANQITASTSTGAVTLSLPAAVTIGTSLTVSGLTANSFLYSGTAGLLTTTVAPTNGQLLIGNTGGAPTAAALYAGPGVSITNGAGAITINNTGVTSVGLSLPSIFTVYGSPVTTTGTLTATLASESANTVFAAPNGSAGIPTFRTLTYADLGLKLYTENPVGQTSPTAAGTNAIGFGSGTQATATSSEAHGLQSIARVYGEVAGAAGNFATIGDAQNGVYMLRIITTNATPAIAFLDGASAKLVLPINSAFFFDADIVARRTDATGTYGAWNIRGLITRDATAGTTAIQGFTSVTGIARTGAGLSNSSVSATADTSNGALQFNVTGVAAETIRWVITCKTTEVTN